MCNEPDREGAMAVIRRDEDGEPTVWCDPCLADLIDALNDPPHRTVASCCGHGHRPGSIILADGRVLLVCKDLAEADAITAHYPDIHGSLSPDGSDGIWLAPDKEAPDA